MIFTNIVEIPFERIKTETSFRSYGITAYAIELAQWCKDRGLMVNRDFTWEYNPTKEKLIFAFSNSARSYSTMFALTFGGGN